MNADLIVALVALGIQVIFAVVPLVMPKPEPVPIVTSYEYIEQEPQEIQEEDR